MPVASSEDYARLAAKTDQLGGLYIYRNGIQVLPYGDTDFDWLGIELRRSKSAYYYYFSHRKMFGAITIDSGRNAKLQEKAGREGFQQNKAYRQFRSILENFFIQLASDFFREEGVHSDSFDLGKSKLAREDKARKERDNHVSVRRKSFTKDLEDFFIAVREGNPDNEALDLTRQIEAELGPLHAEHNGDRTAQKILDIERRGRAAIVELEDRYRITRPRIGLSKSLLRDWEAYQAAFKHLKATVFRPTRDMIEEMIGEVVERDELLLDRRARIQDSLDHLVKTTQQATGRSGRQVQGAASELVRKAKETASQSLKEVDNEFCAVVSEFQRTNVSDMAQEQFVEKRVELENRIRKVGEDQIASLNFVLEQLQAISFKTEHSVGEQLMAVEQRNIRLEEEAEMDTQLAQIGMAIEIINHEFSGTVRAIRIALRRLKAWADTNEALSTLYDDIRASFDHLDGYLTLFTPLQRRLYRKEVDIKGTEISRFLAELFRARLERHKIVLTATQDFRRTRVRGFPSDFYPVFVNLLDNAIFWVSHRKPNDGKGQITLDACGATLSVADNGPGIDLRDKDAVFEFGFSRKPGGRGMGLHIARETLRRAGYDLLLEDAKDGAKFSLRPKPETTEES